MFGFSILHPRELKINSSHALFADGQVFFSKNFRFPPTYMISSKIIFNMSLNSNRYLNDTGILHKICSASKLKNCVRGSMAV